VDSKNVIFSNPPMLNIFSPKFQGSFHGKINAKGTDVAKPMLLSGCPTKAHVSAKNTKIAFLALKRHLSGQPDNMHIG
jgi:hypothetical protein